MNRVKNNSPSRVIYPRVINKTLVKGVHRILALPMVGESLVPTLEEHDFHVVRSAID